MPGHIWEILLILAVVALIFFGPRRLPELGESLGKAIKEFRKATTEVTEGIRDEVRRSDGPPAVTGTTYPGTATSAEPPVPATQPTHPAQPSEAPRA